MWTAGVSVDLSRWAVEHYSWHECSFNLVSLISVRPPGGSALQENTEAEISADAKSKVILLSQLMSAIASKSTEIKWILFHMPLCGVTWHLLKVLSSLKGEACNFTILYEVTILYESGKEGFFIRHCLDQFSPAPQNAIGVSVTILGWSGCSNHNVCHQRSRFSRKSVYKWLTYICLCILKCYFFTFIAKFLTILMSMKIGSKIVISGKHLHQQQSSLMKLQSK